MGRWSADGWCRAQIHDESSDVHLFHIDESVGGLPACAGGPPVPRKRTTWSEQTAPEGRSALAAFWCCRSGLQIHEGSAAATSMNCDSTIKGI